MSAPRRPEGIPAEGVDLAPRPTPRVSDDELTWCGYCGHNIASHTSAGCVAWRPPGVGQPQVCCTRTPADILRAKIDAALAPIEALADEWQQIGGDNPGAIGLVTQLRAAIRDARGGGR